LYVNERSDEVLTLDENWMFRADKLAHKLEWQIKVWKRINSDSLHQSLSIKCNQIERMAFDKNELLVKTEENIILFNLEKGDQIWNLPWDINSNYPISSNEIKQDIHIWKTEIFWNHFWNYDEESPKDMCRYSKFQLIRLIFKQKL